MTKPAKSKVKPEAEPAVELRIPASAEYVRVVRLAATGVASRLNFTYEEIEDIKLALAEACNNAILHAALPTAKTPATHSPTILITITPHPDRLEISVTDEGRIAATDLADAARRAQGKRAASPVNDATDLRESGFGLLLIQSLMDVVEHQADKHANTSIHMTKDVRPAANP